jgi:hypothetical protein
MQSLRVNCVKETADHWAAPGKADYALSVLHPPQLNGSAALLSGLPAPNTRPWAKPAARNLTAW